MGRSTESGPRTRQAAHRDADHLLVPSFRLEVIEGPDRGATWSPSSDRTVVGIHPSADVVLTDPTVSRFHCELVPSERGVRLRDLESLNGTLVEGAEVIDAYLRRPTTLTLGDTRILVAPADERLRIPLAAGDRFGPLSGASAAMRAVFSLLERAAASDATVLIEGETGTGKDLAASAIHGASPRADGPFVVVDCGAVPRDLIESELFGHVRGAFTSASSDRAGAFEQASGGTLFLDEIGELELELQPALLRVLESRQVKRVGADRPVPVDVRIIAATNRGLAGEVNSKRFRSDLYYRLAVLVVQMPPLRARPEDLPLLVDAILESIGAAGDPRADVLREERSLAHLAGHPWPGNVRELRNHVERVLAFGALVPPVAEQVTEDGAEVDVSQPYRLARQRWLDRFERIYLERLLAAHGDNVSAAARAARVDRVHLHRLLARAGLR